MKQKAITEIHEAHIWTHMNNFSKLKKDVQNVN